MSSFPSKTAQFIIFLSLCCITSYAQATPLLFNSQETRFGNLTLFPKWMSMLTRHNTDVKNDNFNCNHNYKSLKCFVNDWRALLDTLKTASFDEKLQSINNFANNASYILDSVNWGVIDYWATPRQFLIKEGDCEDYAIAKYVSLKLLGIPAENMRIVVLNDNNLDTLHSVLAVYHNSSIYILDNQVQQVIKSENIHHYSPIYSINEQSWWRHTHQKN